MITEDQTAVIDFLSAPSTHGGATGASLLPLVLSCRAASVHSSAMDRVRERLHDAVNLSADEAQRRLRERRLESL